MTQAGAVDVNQVVGEQVIEHGKIQPHKCGPAAVLYCEHRSNLEVIVPRRHRHTRPSYEPPSSCRFCPEM